MATSVHASINISCCLLHVLLFCRLILMYSGLTLTIRVNHRAAPFFALPPSTSEEAFLMPTFHTPFAMLSTHKHNTYGLRRIIYLVALHHEESAT